MKEYGQQYDKTINNLKTIFGDEFKDQDQKKYATVLNNTSYPDLEGDPEKAAEQYVDEAQALLELSAQPYKGAFFRQGVEIVKLGKPKGYQKEELHQKLTQLSAQAARVLLGYEEELDLSVSYVMSEHQEMHLTFRLATEDHQKEAILPLIRGVYSQVSAKEFSDRDSAIRFQNRLYGVLTVPFRDHNQEQEREQQRYISNWVDAVLATLPKCIGYRVTLKSIPLGEKELAKLRTEMEALQKIADNLMLYAEIDWNCSTNVGANYNREKSVWGNAGDKIKHIATSVDPISGSYNETFAQAHHEKNKRVEMLLRRIDHRLYRLDKAIQTKA